MPDKRGLAMTDTNNSNVLEVAARSETGKNACRRIRAVGQVPGNVYGMDLPAFAITMDPRQIEDFLRVGSGRNTIFTLSASGGKETREVMIRELQRDPITERLWHVDFVRVDPKMTVRINVPVHLLGTPEGVKSEGGLIDFVHRTVAVSCLPSSIPEHFEVDVSELHIGQHVSVKDLEARGDFEILDDGEMIIAVVAAPRAEAEPAAEEEAEAEAEGEEGEAAEGEPEAIKKGKRGEPEETAGEER